MACYRGVGIIGNYDAHCQDARSALLVPAGPGHSPQPFAKRPPHTALEACAQADPFPPGTMAPWFRSSAQTFSIGTSAGASFRATANAAMAPAA